MEYRNKLEKLKENVSQIKKKNDIKHYKKLYTILLISLNLNIFFIFNYIYIYQNNLNNLKR
jgi:hypothetical protein